MKNWLSIKNFMAQKLRLWIPVIILLLSVFFMFAGSNEPVPDIFKDTMLESWLYKMHIGNSIVFGLATSMFSGIVVWFLVVYIPEQQRRNILKRSLSTHYRNFKIKTIRILLYGVEDVSEPEYEGVDLPRLLCDHREFKKFFKYNDYNDERWYEVANFLSDRGDYLKDLLVGMEIFGREVAHVRNILDIHDEDVYRSLGYMENWYLVRQNTNVHCDYDYMKSLMRFLWSVFAQWNHTEGQHKEDPIQRMIDSI